MLQTRQQRGIKVIGSFGGANGKARSCSRSAARLIAREKSTVSASEARVTVPPYGLPLVTVASLPVDDST